MSVDEEGIKELFEEYFGHRGIFLLFNEMEKLGLRDLSSMYDEDKELLIESIMDDLFRKTLSPEKFTVLRHKLRNLMGLRSEASM